MELAGGFPDLMKSGVRHIDLLPMGVFTRKETTDFDTERSWRGE
jgi:hypothetical protein